MPFALALPVGSMVTYLALAGLGVLAVVAAVLSVFYFTRARVYERIESTLPASGGEATEMRALGERIEALVGQQQLQGETQRQMLAQKIDAIGQHFDEQRHAVDGVRNEMRHETRRRDAEMDEIRHQIAAIQQAVPAIAASAPLALAAPEASSEASPAAPPAPAEPAAADAPFEDVTYQDLPFEDLPFEDLPFEAPPVAHVPFDDVPTPLAVDDALISLDAPSGDSAPGDPVPFEPFSFETPAEAVAAEEPAEVLLPDDPFAWTVVDAAPDAPTDASLEDAPEIFAARVAPAAFEPAAFEPTAPEPADFPSDPFEMPVAATPEPQATPDGFAFETFDAPIAQPPAYAAPADAAPPVSPFDTWSVVTPDELPAAAPDAGAWVARSDRPEALDFSAPAFASPAFAAPDEFDPFAVAAPAAPPPLAASAAEPFALPAGADDLTVVSSIDADVQHALYLAGITRLDEIARWGRGDARRVATQVGVPEETIMNQWIFEAQAALFDQFARQTS